MKILGLLSCGRSGADLFQSLLDNLENLKIINSKNNLFYLLFFL